jgi:hypothetical protein
MKELATNGKFNEQKDRRIVKEWKGRTEYRDKRVKYAITYLLVNINWIKFFHTLHFLFDIQKEEKSEEWIAKYWLPSYL